MAKYTDEQALELILNTVESESEAASEDETPSDFIEGVDPDMEIPEDADADWLPEGEEPKEEADEPWNGIDREDVLPPEPAFHPKRAPGPQLLPGVAYSVLDLFHLFISPAMLTEIMNNSNEYGHRRFPEAWRDISLDDVYSYISIVIFMGLVPLKTLEDYWDSSALYNLPFPRSVMSGRKFSAISRCLHLSSIAADEANAQRKGTAEYDRLGKIQPMYQQLREACMAHFHPRQHVSIDERMVKSKARISLRQDMEDKPTRWGYKLFALADAAAGYTWDFFIHEGKGQTVTKGLSYDSVVRLMDVDMLGQGYKLYVDNFYTSPALFLDLLDRRVWACGTIRQARIGFPRNRAGALEEDKRSPRGTIRWIREGSLLFVGWKDTKEIYLCSTMHAAHGGHSVQRPVETGQRWVEQAIPAPPIVVDYKRHMGGVNLSDAMIGNYKVLHKTRKWYKTFFYLFIDIGIVNAFVLHQELARERNEKALSQQEFREALVEELKAVGSPPTAVPQAPPPAPAGAPHRPYYFTQDEKNRRHCVACKRKVMTECRRCGMAFCVMVDRNCFNQWHDDKGL